MRATQFLFEYKRNITLNKLGDKLVKASSNKKSAEQILSALENIDPTTNKQYTIWLAQQYINGKLPIDVQTANWLSEFHSIKQRLPNDKRDINQYTWQEFSDLMSSLTDIDFNKPNTLYPIYPKIEGSQILYNGPFGQLAMLETEDAACALGRGTRWCTTSGAFENYASEGPLVVWHDKNGQKYQFHLTSYDVDDWEIKDSSDKDIDDDTLSSFYDHPILSKLFDSNRRQLQKLFNSYQYEETPALIRMAQYNPWQFLKDDYKGDINVSNNRYDEAKSIALEEVLWELINVDRSQAPSLYDYNEDFLYFIWHEAMQHGYQDEAIELVGNAKGHNTEIVEKFYDKYKNYFDIKLPWHNIDNTPLYLLTDDDRDELDSYGIPEIISIAIEDQFNPELRELFEDYDWKFLIKLNDNYYMSDGYKITTSDSDTLESDDPILNYLKILVDNKVLNPENIYNNFDSNKVDYDLNYDEEDSDRLVDPDHPRDHDLSYNNDLDTYTDEKDTDEYEIDDPFEWPEEHRPILRLPKSDENWRKTHSHLLDPNYNDEKPLDRNLDKLQDKMYKQTSKKLNNKKVSENIDRLRLLAGIKWTS